MIPSETLGRRAALLLPFLLLACGGEAPKTYTIPRYNYLPPLRLNVGSVEIVQRYFPSGIAPDISNQAPFAPVQAARTLAEDRLQAFGTSGRAVFSIIDAPLTKQGDVINGAMRVLLEIYTQDNTRAGFAEARVALRHSGRIENLRATLFEMTKSMLDDMNVEFEYQVRRNLKEWLTTPTAASTPVEQAPLGLPSLGLPLAR